MRYEKETGDRTELSDGVNSEGEKE